jgi:4-amino-4-deoxy-L-arabinose transferase-like glycosyltransferase
LDTTDYRVSQKISEGDKSIAYAILLILLCGVLYFPYLSSTPFFGKGEPREALAVQDIVERGEWLVPLKRATEIPSKPPLFHWSAALTAALTGKLDETTIRFPSALYATLGVLIIYLFGQKLFERQVAFLAAAILATTWIYVDQALNARVDMTLCFVVTLNLVLFYSLYRGLLTHPLWFYIFYILLGIGILAKGPLGIVLPGLVIGTFVAVKKKWDLIPKFCLHPGVLLTVLLGVGWCVAAVTRGGEGFFYLQIL